jgi:hypothetical protein
MRCFIPVVSGAIVLFGALEFARASSIVVKPSQPVAGISQLELSQQWWQWVLGIPAATNPLTDTDGTLAGTNNNGPVFFVAGNTGGSSTRTFSVPVGKPIFFPVINAFDVEVPGGGCDLACAFGYLAYVNDASNLHATLDGQTLLTYPSSRQTSTAFFNSFLPIDNVFGFTAPYVGTLDTISDGFWVALEGLTRGQHTLIFGGALPGFELEVTDNITAIPEPATIVLLILGAAGMFGIARRRR